MGKETGVAIYELHKKKNDKYQIRASLKLKRQDVDYWLKKIENGWTPKKIKEIKTRKKKIPVKYIHMMVDWAKDVPCSLMSTRKIARKLNKYFKRYKIINESTQKVLSVRHTTVNSYLNKFLEKPRKIRKNFYLSEKQMKKRVQFCNQMLKRNIKGEDIFFTDETQIDLCNYTNDYIRLSKTNQKKLKKGELDVYELITRPVKKFEKSIMVAGGISSEGVGRLMIHDGNQNEFCYAQALLFYKKDVGDRYFEQDGAPSHTSKANTALINELFKNKFIQNPPNSPDIAYPIEDLWAILKNRVKRRNPKNLEELKKFLFEEWYSIPTTLTKKLTDNFIKRLKLIKELHGARLEPEHLKKIKHKEGEYGDRHIWKKRDFKILTIYNDEQLLKHKNKEIALMKKILRGVPSHFKKKFAKNPLPKKKIGLQKIINKKNKEIRELKKKTQIEIKEEIDKIEKMSLLEYLKHFREKNNDKDFVKVKKSKKEENEEIENEEENDENEDEEDNEEDAKDNEDESTIDDPIANISKLDGLKMLNDNISYKLAF